MPRVERGAREVADGKRQRCLEEFLLKRLFMGTVNRELDTQRHCSYLPKSGARKCVVYETIRPVTGTVRAR